MDSKDFQRIEELFSRFSAEFDQKLDHQRLEFKGLLVNQADDFKNWIGTEREDFQHKLDLVVEGQHALVGRMDNIEGRLLRASLGGVDDGIDN